MLSISQGRERILLAQDKHPLCVCNVSFDVLLMDHVCDDAFNLIQINVTLL